MGSVKDVGGQPPKYKDEEELQNKIDSYFKSLVISTDESGNEMCKPATICGLAYHLGFESRQSIYDYKKNDRYSYAIKRALLFIESLYEEGLQGRSPAGCIFALKNRGWTDKQELDHNFKNTPKFIIELASDEE